MILRAQRWPVVVAAFLFAAAVWWALPNAALRATPVAEHAVSPPVLEIVDLTSGTTLARFPLRPGAAVRLGYIHSLYGGRVEEELAVLPDGELQLQGIRSDRLAAIEYYALPGRATASPEGYYLAVDGERYPRLPIRVDHLGRRELTYGDVRLPLYDLVGDGDLVEIRAVP